MHGRGSALGNLEVLGSLGLGSQGLSNGELRAFKSQNLANSGAVCLYLDVGIQGTGTWTFVGYNQGVCRPGEQGLSNWY